MPETESLVDRYRPNGHKGSLLFSLLLLALSLVAQVSLARDYLTVDGQFTLCKWNKIKDCELLDAKRERLLDLTKDERKTLHALRRFSEATSFTGQDVLNAFGKPHYSNRDGDELQLIWRLSVPHERGESTVGMVLINQQLSIVTFKVPDKFSIIWYVNPEKLKKAR